jgi:hypothetical protein
LSGNLKDVKFVDGGSNWLKLIPIAFLLVTSAIGGIAIPVATSQSNTSVPPPSSATFSPPQGVPNLANLALWGNRLTSSVQLSPQFKALAHGFPFAVVPGSSFGYMTGPDIAPTVIIIMFSPNRMSYIVTEVNNATGKIEQMYLANDTTTEPSWGGAVSVSTSSSTPPSWSSSPTWAGYAAQDCAGSIFGY